MSHSSQNKILEIRDTDLARRFMLEGLLVQRVDPPSPETLPAVLEWSLEAASEAVPLPPIGVIADLGRLIFVSETAPRSTSQSESPSIAEQWLPATLIRRYEDFFLGKLYMDRSFGRAIDGACRYSDPRDRAKALAFVLRQLGTRAGFPGVHFSPGVIRQLSRLNPEVVLQEAAQSFTDVGPMLWQDVADGPEDFATRPLLAVLYDDLIQSVRSLGDVLAAEDIFELEHGTAVAGFGQRMALRQVLHAANDFENSLPHQPIRPLQRRQQVATRILDEDLYPIGGFSSISNRGSVESLLHSQLAYMEDGDRPDLFDIKYLRDELLYYARDENQFLRRRRVFRFALLPDLTHARIKDASLPHQRIVLLMGLLVAATRKLADWLSEDALTFDLVFVKPEKTKTKRPADLADERELFEILFQEQIANGLVHLQFADSLDEFRESCIKAAQRSACHAVICSTRDQNGDIENAFVTRFRLSSAIPELAIGNAAFEPINSAEPIECWRGTVLQLLAACLDG